MRRTKTGLGPKQKNTWGQREPIVLSVEDQTLVDNQSEKAMAVLKKGYRPGIGLYTALDPKGQFFGEIWARDSAMGVMTLARVNSKAVIDTLNTLFRYQKPDGTLPLRVEYKRHWANYVPILRGLKKIGIDFISREKAYPVYENVKHALPARDTAPAIIIACGKIFRTSKEGQDFVKQKWDKMKAAIKREDKFIDPKDGLVKGESLQDWADSIMRRGKLSFVNILYYHAINEMAFMAGELAKTDEAKNFLEKSQKLRKKNVETFWDEEKGYIKAGEDDSRLDAPANILACLYLVDPNKAVRIQDSLKSRVTASSGLLRNFDPLYPTSMITFRHKLGGISGYHNTYTWPWVTCLNILAKLAITERHPDENIRERFSKEAVEDLVNVSRVHQRNGSYHEVLFEDGRPVESKFMGINLYMSSPGFLGSVASFIAARNKINRLNII